MYKSLCDSVLIHFIKLEVIMRAFQKSRIPKGVFAMLQEVGVEVFSCIIGEPFDIIVRSMLLNKLPSEIKLLEVLFNKGFTYWNSSSVSEEELNTRITKSA
jgi:hypothetical protein